MKLIRHIALMFLLVLSFTSKAQVTTDKPLQMTGPTNSDRQIIGLSDPAAGTDVVNAGTVQKGTLIYATAAGTNALSISYSPAITAYTEGMLLSFVAPALNTGPVTLNINGLGPVALVKGVDAPVDSTDIRYNEVITVMYDGSSFQLLSRNDRSCPAGFVSPNTEYCIEINERTTANFWIANNKCTSIGGRLCTWGEWYYACQKSGLGLINMTNNYEWTISGSNHAVDAWTPGQGSCQAGTSTTTVATQPRTYRCCYSK